MLKKRNEKKKNLIEAKQKNMQGSQKNTSEFFNKLIIKKINLIAIKLEDLTFVYSDNTIEKCFKGANNKI